MGPHTVHRRRYCINRALRLSPSDETAQYTRAAVLLELGQDKKGGDAYRLLFRQRPHDAAVAAEIARLSHAAGDAEGAIGVLEQCLRHNVVLAATSTAQVAGFDEDIEEGEAASEEHRAAESLDAQLHLVRTSAVTRAPPHNGVVAARAASAITSCARAGEHSG